MSEARRIVRATADFFQDLDRQLRPERGPAGEPSANDFQVFELIRIVDRFATGFDELPELIPVDPTIDSSSPPGCWSRGSPLSVSWPLTAPSSWFSSISTWPTKTEGPEVFVRVIARSRAGPISGIKRS